LSTDPTLTNAKLKALADKDPRVNAFTSAYPNEELLQADIAHTNTRNSFTSLPPAAKATAQARAEEARVILEGIQ